MTTTAMQTSVAAFDLDGTLVRGSSFGQFVRLLICRSPWRLAVALLLVAPSGPLLVARQARTWLGQACVWLATVGRSHDELARRARTFAGFHAGADSANRIEVALARVAVHASRGHHVVVVTAAVEPVASEVVRALGIEACVLAPRLRPFCGGWVPETARRGDAKVVRLLAAGHRLPIEYAYTDSADDIALLRAARHRVAVQPRPANWRALRAAVPDCVQLTKPDLR